MKNYINKIIVGVFSFALLFAGQSSFASGIWNTASNDCPTINVANTENSAGWGNPCWNGTNISANPGDIINVRVYYHNTGNTTATNTRLILNAQTSSSTRHSFSTQITSNQGSLSSGQVYINLPSSQTLTFGTVYWYTANTSQTLTPLLNGQNGSEILNSPGLLIGDITPGWSSYGFAVISFVVGENVPPAPACEISNFSARDTSIEEGDYATLRWNTNNCNRVYISNIGNVFLDGSRNIYPNRDTTYTLTAYNTNGSSQTATVRVYVDDNNTVLNCDIDSFTSSSSYVRQGDAVTLRWNTTDCNNVNISNIGNVSKDGSRTVYPNGTTTYVLSAYGATSESRTIRVNVENTPIFIPAPTPVYNTNVVTTVATNVSQTGAQVNGLITSTNYTSANTYFEYGTDVSLGLRTTTRTTNGNASFSDQLTNLSPNTIYFYQAVASGQNGISRGSIDVFRTLGAVNNNTTQAIKQVVYQGTTVAGSESPIMLKIENRYESIGKGDLVDYVVTYKNIGKSKLTDPMIQVFIPKGITLTNLSEGIYSEDSKTLSVPIEDLLSGQERVIYLQGRVDNLEENLAQIVTTAILVYTNPNGAQENAMAYVLNNPKNNPNNLLGASAFFGNPFGLGLIGWLLLIILIMLLVLISRSYFGHRKTAVASAPVNH